MDRRTLLLSLALAAPLERMKEIVPPLAPQKEDLRRRATEERARAREVRPTPGRTPIERPRDRGTSEDDRYPPRWPWQP